MPPFCLALAVSCLTQRLTFADSDMTSIGDVKDLSSTAAVMLKTSILAAWARFQTASTRQPYLVDVIRPHLPLLCPFWVASLREYARMHVDPTALSSEAGSAFDSVYSGLSRETVLPVRSGLSGLGLCASLNWTPLFAVLRERLASGLARRCRPAQVF